MNKKKLVSSLLALVFVLGLFFVNSVLDKFVPENGDTGLTGETTGFVDPTDAPKATEAPKSTESTRPTLDRNGSYTTKEDVPASVIEEEKAILLKQMEQDPKMANKPEVALKKIIEGKI